MGIHNRSCLLLFHLAVERLPAVVRICHCRHALRDKKGHTVHDTAPDARAVRCPKGTETQLKPQPGINSMMMLVFMSVTLMIMAFVAMVTVNKVVIRASDTFFSDKYMCASE